MNVELPAEDFLTEFLLEQIACQPIERRLLLYRALAVKTHDAKLAAACTERGDQIEKFLNGERQMLLDFKRRARG